jgi:hypothetical protein
MLNGDAHHEKGRDGELRIGRCRISNSKAPKSITEGVALIIRGRIVS